MNINITIKGSTEILPINNTIESLDTIDSYLTVNLPSNLLPDVIDIYDHICYSYESRRVDVVGDQYEGLTITIDY